MRRLILLLFVLALTSTLRAADRTPVLVELFTSEGCSSCPPADRLLIQLQAQQPVVGADIIVLSEHVDYWNSLGWRDPFSAALFTKRQADYGDALKTDSYTPQMVVDGTSPFVGSNSDEALAAIRQAASVTKPAISLAVNGQSIHISVPHGEAGDVFLAIAENNLTTAVTRGENKGSTISHVGVVRKMSAIGKTSTTADFTTDIGLSLSREWKPADLRIVVFLQSSKTHRIVSAASVPFRRN